MYRQAALLFRRSKTRLRMTVEEIAEFLFVDHGSVSRWMNGESRQTINLSHLLIGPDKLVDEVISALAEARENNGYAVRRWVALGVDDTRAAPGERATRLEQLMAAQEKLRVASAELDELVARMR